MTASSAKAPLIEVFHSIQGEGRFVGAPMTFLRVATCPIRCSYCDTPHSYQASPEFVVRTRAGERGEANPVSATRAAELVAEVSGRWAGGQAPSLSITGGEPLVSPRFVRELGASMRDLGWRVHLETAALDARALETCIGSIDHLSADYKLPGTLSEEPAGEGDFRRAHVDCCVVAVERGVSVDVKMVLTPGVEDASLHSALDELAHLRDRILLILQPVTPFGGEPEPLGAACLERHVEAVRDREFDFRVLPQVHRQLGLH